MREQDIRAIVAIIEAAAREIREVLEESSPPKPEVHPATRPPAKAAVYPVGPRRAPERRPDCPDCGDEMLPSKWPKPGREFFCMNCFKGNKEAERQ